MQANEGPGTQLRSWLTRNIQCFCVLLYTNQMVMISGLERPETPEASGRRASEHPHRGLWPEHDLLIRGQDQRLLPRHVVRLGGDVPLAIEEEHPQQISDGAEQVDRDDADGAAGPGRREGGHGREGERRGRSAPARRRPARGASLRAIHVSPCAVRKPGQDGWRDRQ